MKEKNYFSGGLLTELLILSILSKRDSYAYEIRKIIQNTHNDMLAMSQNTIYIIIYKLEEENKISQYTKLVGKRRSRVYYHIEENGKEYYNQLLSNFRDTVNCVEEIISASHDPIIER